VDESITLKYIRITRQTFLPRFVLAKFIATLRNAFRQMTLRRDAFPASPVNARLSRAPHLPRTSVFASMIRRLMDYVSCL
jgi:hypothetical protein